MDIFAAVADSVFKWLMHFHVSMFRTPGLEQLTLDEHTAIVDAIEVGNPERDRIAADREQDWLCHHGSRSDDGRSARHDQISWEDEKLSLRTFFEVFIGYFYNMMKDMMDR